MSHEANTKYIEETRDDFYIYLTERDWEKCEKIVEDLKINNYIDEALELEIELETTIEEKNAWEKGSEDGMDALQDK